MTTNKIELFLVDRDPIFRLGLSVALKAFPDLVIISQEDTAMATLGQLAQGIIPDILVIEMDSVECKNKRFGECYRPLEFLLPCIVCQHCASLCVNIFSTNPNSANVPLNDRQIQARPKSMLLIGRGSHLSR